MDLRRELPQRDIHGRDIRWFTTVDATFTKGTIQGGYSIDIYTHGPPETRYVNIYLSRSLADVDRFTYHAHHMRSEPYVHLSPGSRGSIVMSTF
jgi:hypothetical protein